MGVSARVNRKMRGLSVHPLGLLAALTNGQGSAMKEIMEGIDMYNFRARCWGEANVDKQIAALETAKKICSQEAGPRQQHPQRSSERRRPQQCQLPVAQ